MALSWEKANSLIGQLSSAPVGSELLLKTDKLEYQFFKIDFDMWVNDDRRWPAKQLVTAFVQQPIKKIIAYQIVEKHVRRALGGELLFAILCNRSGIFYALYREDLRLAELGPFLEGVTTRLCRQVLKMRWNEVGTLLDVTRINSSGYRVKEQYPATNVVYTVNSFDRGGMKWMKND